ncbi:MAG: glycosyltransferase, partial [Planctomycetota bacterium]
MSQSVKLSIVIPAPGDTQALEETLVSVLENRPAHCEVIVALGCEYADPWNIGDEVQFVRAEGLGLVACVNAGIAASTGSVVHLLAAGWKATPGWTEAALVRLRDSRVGAVAAVAVQAALHEQVAA